MMSKFLILISFICISCNQGTARKDLTINIKERVYENSFIDSSITQGVNVKYSQKGAEFTSGALSFIEIDSLHILTKDGLNVSFWFQYTGEDPTKEQMLFSLRDSLNPKNRINFWLAAGRLTGVVNNVNLWAKEYDYVKGASSDYYDLFRLELGKYYFLSVNSNRNQVEVYLNGEQYAKYEALSYTDWTINQVYLGIYKDLDSKHKYQFQGYIRNLTMFNKTLNSREIEALSLESYQEIRPYNDTFELSKFKMDSLGQN